MAIEIFIYVFMALCLYGVIDYFFTSFTRSNMDEKHIEIMYNIDLIQEALERINEKLFKEKQDND